MDRDFIGKNKSELKKEIQNILKNNKVELIEGSNGYEPYSPINFEIKFRMSNQKENSESFERNFLVDFVKKLINNIFRKLLENQKENFIQISLNEYKHNINNNKKYGWIIEENNLNSFIAKNEIYKTTREERLPIFVHSILGFTNSAIIFRYAPEIKIYIFIEKIIDNYLYFVADIKFIDIFNDINYFKVDTELIG